MAKKPALPDTGCPALASLAPFITDKARKMAAERLNMSDEKVSLLIVKAINPYAILTIEEQAVLRGVTRKTLGKMISNGEARRI